MQAVAHMGNVLDLPRSTSADACGSSSRSPQTPADSAPAASGYIGPAGMTCIQYHQDSTSEGDKNEPGKFKAPRDPGADRCACRSARVRPIRLGFDFGVCQRPKRVDGSGREGY